MVLAYVCVLEMIVIPFAVSFIFQRDNFGSTIAAGFGAFISAFVLLISRNDTQIHKCIVYWVVTLFFFVCLGLIQLPLVRNVHDYFHS